MANLPKIALGAWAWGNDGTFGNSLTAESLQPIFDTAMANGLNLWDTAYAYGMGTSEKVLAGFLKGLPRESYLISDKFTPQCANGKPTAMADMIEMQLKLMELEHFDIYWIHNVWDAPHWTEELAKFLMIAAAFKLFRSTVRNVYEYMLIGAAVGFGFTLPEEFLYGSDLITFLLRLDFIAGHLVFGLIMTYYLGLAEHKKITNQGSSAKEYLFALLIPILLHTLYDACTANNKFLSHNDENMQSIGIIIGLVWSLAAFVVQIMILLKYKKNAEKLCSLRLLPEAS